MDNAGGGEQSLCVDVLVQAVSQVPALVVLVWLVYHQSTTLAAIVREHREGLQELSAAMVSISSRIRCDR